MNLLRKVITLKHRVNIKDIVSRSICSFVLPSDVNCNLEQRSRIAFQCIQSRLCSTSSLPSRESFDEFRAREERKEKETIHQNSSCNNIPKRKDGDDAKVLAIRDAILSASLDFVPSNGWSKQAIAKGAESVDYPSLVNGLFPRGGIELVKFFNTQCNEKLIENLKQENIKTEMTIDPASFVKKAIEMRLRMLIPYLKHWPQALGLMTLSPNVPNSLANVLTMIDDICYYAGDRSVDFNWYTRRVGLTSIFKTTELYMLQDSSADFENTWKFLERRIQEASVAHDFLLKSEDATSHIQNVADSVFSTARNILGLSFERR